MNEILIPLKDLNPNPFQPRKSEDLAAMIELAENIERNTTVDFDGMLQVPTARQVQTHYELAFGHTRKAAFAQLGREAMRVQVRDLSDLQMFEIAVSENIKRRDLNPMEQAEAIRTYMDTFGKTSAEAAEFFGVAAATIRGTVRLLNLPEAAREKVRRGEIKAGEARALLVVEKLLGEKGVTDVLEKMDDDHDGAIEAINKVLRWGSGALRLDRDNGWVKANPFPQKHLEAIKEEEIKSLFGDELKGTRADMERLVTIAQAGMIVTDEAFTMFEPDALEKLRVLMNPPACDQCSFHAVLGGDDYCAFKDCAIRKDEAWKKEELDEAAKETGIALYEKADGKKINLDRNDKKLVQKRHADLRLTLSKNMVWNNFEGVSAFVQVVAVGRLAEEQEQPAQKPAEDWELIRVLSSICQGYTKRFAWEVAARALASALEGVTSLPLLLRLEDEFSRPSFPDEVIYSVVMVELKKAKKPEALKQARRLVMMGVLNRVRVDTTGKAIMKYSEACAELAQEMSVKLPKDWSAQAEKYQQEFESAQKEAKEARKQK